MSQSNMLISGERRLATELRSRDDANGNSYEEHFQHFVPTAIGAVPTLLSKKLDLAVDGSAADVEVELAPGSDEVYRIDRLMFVLVTTGAPVMTTFGSVAALTVGIKLEWANADEVLVDLLHATTVKKLNDLVPLGRMTVLGNTFQLEIDLPVPIRLDGAEAEVLRATVQDNLTAAGITSCQLWAMGAIEELT